ncbi:MAG: glycosyltransferase [Acidimicrobiales bacterium]
MADPNPCDHRLDQTHKPPRQRRGILPFASTRSNPCFAFLSWGAIGGRSEEIAAALGGEARCFYPAGKALRPPVALRYAMSAFKTAWYLASRRPDAVIVTNPPVFAGLITYAVAQLTGTAVGLDSHPGSFGAQEDHVSARLLPLHRWLVRRCGITLVTTQQWCDVVESWHGHSVIVHEAPGRWLPTPPPKAERPRILYVGRFAPDEPTEELILAAATIPGCDFYVTGRTADCPQSLRDNAPANVHFVGFLDQDAYEKAVYECGLVVTLTTEPTSVMRAAYEATYATRPLIISDWPVGRNLFPHALHVKNDAMSIAAAIHEALSDHDSLVARTLPARDAQITRWRSQEAALRTWIRDGSPRL